MSHAELLDLLRRARVSLDSLLGLTGEEDGSFQHAMFEVAEEVAEEIHRATEPRPDPGGPRVIAAIPDLAFGDLARELRERAEEIEEETGSPFRLKGLASRRSLRRSLLDSMLYAIQAGDPTLSVLLAALFDDLDAQGRLDLLGSTEQR